MEKAQTNEPPVATKSNAADQKNAANLKRTLGQALLAFERVREWADYGHWLQKVAKCLEDYPSAQIPEKLTFAKRLAQCLNPNLPPAIHNNTIQVYSLIFKNFREAGYNWCEDLGLYSIGLFPLFQYASFQVKPKILTLYRDHYFPLGKQLIPCITGLAVSILPGVEEQNEALQRNVFSTLDQLSVCVTKKYFIGAVWMAVLRNPKVRLAAIKYLQRRLKRSYIDPEENEEGERSESEDESPEPKKIENEEEGSPPKDLTPLDEKDEVNTETVSEAVTGKEETKEDITVLEEQTTRVHVYQPTAEDLAFLQSLDQIDENDIDVEYPNKSSLVLNALVACMEDTDQLVQKICLDFLHSHFKLATELFTEREKFILIEAALTLLIKKDQQILRRVYTWIFGPADMENRYQVNEKNEFVLDYLIQSFSKIFHRVPRDAQQATLPLKVLQTFYMEHDHLAEHTLPHLALPFLSYISKYSQPGNSFAEDVHKAGARFMENITSYFSLILTSLSGSLEQQISEQNSENCLEIINLIEFTFKLEASITNKEENVNLLEQKDYLKAIISGILRSTSSISPDQKNLIPFVETAFNLNLNLIDKLEAVDADLLKLIAEKRLTEAEIAHVTQESTKDFGFTETLESFSQFYERLVNKIFTYHAEDQIPQKLLNLLAVTSETIVKVQRFRVETALYSIPPWLHSVIKCVRSPFPAVSIIGIKTVQSFLIPKSKKAIYESIKNLITSEGDHNKTSDIIQRTTEKLWALLDVHYIQNTVSDLLIIFQAYFPQVFAETVSNSFHSPSITEKEAAIRRFGSFWKLSSDLSKSDFIESGTGLFIMLDFLDNDNPLLRHSSKSWLLDSIAFLYRIIDPIFEILMQSNHNSTWGPDHHLKLYITESKQYFFTEVYDTDLVQDSFRKLKSILITSTELFTRYITSIKISERLKRHSLFFTANELEDPENCTYLDLLVTLCLRYVQGHAIEALSPKFQMQNASVNASASEFMELLVSHLENKELSARITHFIMEPLLTVLHHSIKNNDYVLQVQLLNLLKVILYQSSFCSYEGTKANCINLLSSKKFVPNLLKGLGVDQPYVRVQFINFISMCVTVLTENLNQREVLTNSVISILRAYFEIILSKKLEVSENNDEFEPWDNDNQMNFEDDTASKRIEMAGDSAKKAEETKARAARNTFSVRYQNQNEIYMLLEGVKKILDYFLKFNVVQEQQDTRVFYGAEGPGIFTLVKDIFTQGIVHKDHLEERKDKKEVITSASHADTAKAILKDMFRIVYIFIYCWRLSKEFRQTADFSSVGITAYTFEKYNEINKMIKECHMKIDPNRKNLKSLIISVLKPLTYQYTTETLNSFINYWIMESQKRDDINVNPRMMKEIEILISMNVSTEMFLSTLAKNQIVLDLGKYYLDRLKQNKRGPIVLNYDIARTESQIFFLLYTYISYSFIDINFLKKDFLTKLWTTILNFTKLFSPSKAVSTHLWLIELFHLLALKYNPKEILGDYKLKKEMHAQINGLLVAISNVCAKSVVMYFNDPTGTSDSTKFKTVLPFPPTVYEIYKQYKNSKSASAPSSVNSLGETGEAIPDNVNVEKRMFAGFQEDMSEPSLYDRYRLFGFKTLKQVGLTVIQNSYSPERIDRIIVRTKEFMTIIFPLMENKSPENQPFLECASELLYAQLDSSRSFLLKDYKKNILDIFNANDFFKCSKQTLKYWSKIIDWVVTMDKGDLFTEFLTKWVGGWSSYFSSKDSETKAKIKSFERICFIIYSGERDKYQDKLITLLEKMGDVIKNADSAHPSLLILVLFCIRILILRLSPSSLSELFRHIWPILLTLLMQIFSRRSTQKNPNLLLAALKLIEMMSIVELEEFYINQWVFVFDYFGLTIEPTGEPATQRTSNEPVEGAEPKLPKISNFIYQPYLTSVVDDNLKIDYKSKQMEVQLDHEKVERKILLTMTSVEDEGEIRAKGLMLLQYLIQQNEFRAEVDPQQVESLIEGDFISLDDYIFTIN